MLGWLTEPFGSPIVVRALVEVLILAVACGPLGVWVLLYRNAYAAESISHGMLPGLVVAALIGAPLVLGALGGVLVAAAGIALVAADRRLSGDVGVAVCVSALLGLGGMLALSAATPPRLQELLFGDLLGVDAGDLAVAGVLAGGVAVALAAGHRRLALVGFDRGSARGARRAARALGARAAGGSRGDHRRRGRRSGKSLAGRAGAGARGGRAEPHATAGPGARFGHGPGFSVRCGWFDPLLPLRHRSRCVGGAVCSRMRRVCPARTTKRLIFARRVATIRGVKYRDKVMQRSGLSIWSRRLFGLLGTAAFLAAGALGISMILDMGQDEAVSAAPPVPTAKQLEGGKKLTKAERAQRARAVGFMRRAGYSPVSLTDYRPADQLRVLIGAPFGTSPPGYRAFFFLGDRAIGNDAPQPSGGLKVGARHDRSVALVYTTYDDGDRACCPRGRKVRVRFAWSDGALVPLDPVPPDAERVPPT